MLEQFVPFSLGLHAAFSPNSNLREEEIVIGAHTTEPFLKDVITLRERTRRCIETVLQSSAECAEAEQTIDILQSVLATEIVCVLRYTMHAVSASGLRGDPVQAEYAALARERQDHMMEVAERILHFGGRPNFDPEGLASRAVSQYSAAVDVEDMTRESHVAEQVAAQHYRELVRFFTGKDDGTRRILEHLVWNHDPPVRAIHETPATHAGCSAAAAD